MRGARALEGCGSLTPAASRSVGATSSSDGLAADHTLRSRHPGYPDPERHEKLLVEEIGSSVPHGEAGSADQPVAESLAVVGREEDRGPGKPALPLEAVDQAAEGTVDAA